MEHKSSLPCSQEPRTHPYPQPVHTTPPYPSNIHLHAIHPPTHSSPLWSICLWLFHQYSICVPLLPIHGTCPVYLIFLYLITLIILCKEQNLETPHYTVSFIPLSLHVPSVHIFSSESCSRTPSVYVSLLASETNFLKIIAFYILSNIL
jgi:hypothetical protein